MDISFRPDTSRINPRGDARSSLRWRLPVIACGVMATMLQSSSPD
jgi:hypothetical protein